MENTMKDMEQAIRDVICRVYCADFKGKIDVDEIWDDVNPCLGCNPPKEDAMFRGYRVRFGSGNDAIELYTEQSDLLKFVEKELRQRALHSVKYYKIVKDENC